jgi:hypothetical protein
MSNFKNTAVTISPNTYAGQRYAEYLTPALLAPKGLADRNLVTVIDGIKDTVKMLGVDQPLEFQDPSAAFSAQAGAITRDEKAIDLVKYEVMVQTDFDNLRTSWEAQSLRPGSMNDYLGTTELSDFLLNSIYVPRLGMMNEQLYIQGKAGVTVGGGSATFSANYAGLLGKFEAGSDVNKFRIGDVATAVQAGATSLITPGAAGAATVEVASATNISVGDELTIVGADGDEQIGGETVNGQTVTVLSKAGGVLTVAEAITLAGGASASTEFQVQYVNAANVIDVLTAVYNSIPRVIRTKPDTVIGISRQIEKAYRQANANVADGAGLYLRSDYFGQESIPFLDVRLESMPYWNENQIAVWNPSNVFLAVDLLSDEVSAEIIYLGSYTLDQVFRMKNSMKSGIDFKYGNEVAYWRPVSTL